MTRWEDEHGIPCDPRNGYDAGAILWEELDALPTLTQGQADDLKIETDRQRVWLSRCTTLDGEHCDHHVTVETYNGQRWETTSEN
jgi:hypothetical protein